jgi:selenocysteine-specific elongation factor
MLESAELLPAAAAVVAVSARTGTGLGELQAALDRAAATVRSRAEDAAPARLHVDRVFTIRGAGTVITGTLWSGNVGRGDELELLGAGRRLRVRGVQIHDEPVDRAAAGQRVAVNLTGVDVTSVSRGDVLASAGSGLIPTFRLDASLSFANREPVPGDRVQVHHGTRETPGRMAWLGGRFWQLRLEQPLVPAVGDRLVVRQIAPPDTLGGGVVLDAHPKRHGPSREVLARLERLERGEDVRDAAEERGKGDGPRSGGGNSREPVAPGRLRPSATSLEQRLKDAGFEPPLDSELDAGDLAALRSAGRAIRVSKTLHYHQDVLAEVRRRVLELAERHDGSVTLGQLRDELATSRKFAQALLEHLDSERVTIRRGDAHHVRGLASRGSR